MRDNCCYTLIFITIIVVHFIAIDFSNIDLYHRNSSKTSNRYCCNARLATNRFPSNSWSRGERNSRPFSPRDTTFHERDESHERKERKNEKEESKMEGRRKKKRNDGYKITLAEFTGEESEDDRQRLSFDEDNRNSWNESRGRCARRSSPAFLAF